MDHARVSLEGAEAAARGDLPQLQRPVAASREGIVAVAAQAHGMDISCVTLEGAEAAARGYIPQLQRLVTASREGDAAVVAQEHGQDTICVTLERGLLPTSAESTAWQPDVKV